MLDIGYGPILFRKAFVGWGPTLKNMCPKRAEFKPSQPSN
jgi:hypothetical protein